MSCRQTSNKTKARNFRGKCANIEENGAKEKNCIPLHTPPESFALEARENQGCLCPRQEKGANR